MMVIIPLMFLLSNVISINAGGGHEYGQVWNYQPNSVIGPAKWGNNFTHCGKKKQSPINILTKPVEYNKDLGNLELKNYEETGDNVYFNMENRNTDIAFLAKVKTGDVPQAVVFKGTTYRFYQFHFHWGSKNFQGSEHLIDWQQYAGEMHMIHYNTKYPNISEAVAKDDGLLVWGHFLKVNSRDSVANTQFQTVLSKFGSAKESGNVTKITGINLFKLLPKKHDQFYHYSGSLTTPPCYQSVSWIVDRNPILVSEDQMKLFRQLKDNVMSVPLVDHYRPPQALNGREVQSNFDPTKDTDSAGVTIKPLSMAMLTIAAALILVF